MHELVDNPKITLIAIDEAHLDHQWLEFHTIYGYLEQLKIELPTVPLICLTATAPPPVLGSIMKLFGTLLFLVLVLTNRMYFLHVKRSPV